MQAKNDDISFFTHYLTCVESKTPIQFPKKDNHASASQHYQNEEHHFNAMLQRSFVVEFSGMHIRMTNEDFHLLALIYRDNPHCTQEHVYASLAQSSVINSLQQFYPQANKRANCIQDGIFIDPGHFKHVEDSGARIADLNTYGKKSLKALHNQQQSDLQACRKRDLSAKILSKEQKKIIETKYQHKLSDLQAKQDQEKREGYLSVAKKTFKNS